MWGFRHVLIVFVPAWRSPWCQAAVTRCLRGFAMPRKHVSSSVDTGVRCCSCDNDVESLSAPVPPAAASAGGNSHFSDRQRDKAPLHRPTRLGRSAETIGQDSRPHPVGRLSVMHGAHPCGSVVPRTPPDGRNTRAHPDPRHLRIRARRPRHPAECPRPRQRACPPGRHRHLARLKSVGDRRHHPRVRGCVRRRRRSGHRQSLSPLHQACRVRQDGLARQE